MRQRHMVLALIGALVIGGALAACGGDSGGPSGVACTGNTPPIPDLAGTWTLDTFQFESDAPIAPPTATWSFEFAADSVIVSLVVPDPGGSGTLDIGGTGKCTLTATTLNISSNGLLGQATGTYTFVDQPSGTPDTLHANLVSTNNHIRVVVER